LQKIARSLEAPNQRSRATETTAVAFSAVNKNSPRQRRQWTDTNGFPARQMMQLLQVPVQFLANHMIMVWILCSLNAPLIDQFPELETEAFGCSLRSAINWWLSWWRWLPQPASGHIRRSHQRRCPMLHTLTPTWLIRRIVRSWRRRFLSSSADQRPVEWFWVCIFWLNSGREQRPRSLC